MKALGIHITGTTACANLWWVWGLVLGILAATPLQAGEAKEHEAAITDVQTRVRKNELHVSFTLQLGEAPVKTQHKRILTPVIRTADGRQRVSLPPVVLKGRNRAIAERKNRRNEDSNAYRVLTGKQCKNSRVDYQAETPYQPWMEQAVVTLEEQVTGCAECGVLTQEQPMQSYAVYTPAWCNRRRHSARASLCSAPNSVTPTSSIPSTKRASTPTGTATGLNWPR